MSRLIDANNSLYGFFKSIIQEGDIDLYKLQGEDIIVEAVVAPQSALVHRTVKEVKFR